MTAHSVLAVLAGLSGVVALIISLMEGSGGAFIAAVLLFLGALALLATGKVFCVLMDLDEHTRGIAEKRTKLS